MRQAQIYRWQLPMDAGVVLRNQRLKTRDGLFLHLRQETSEGWGEMAPLPGFSHETLDEAQSALQQWASEWVRGANPPCPALPSVAFGISCALAELDGTLPQQADYHVAPLCNGDPDALLLRLAAMPGEKVAKMKVGLYEAVRDGMMANLLLESIPDLTLRLDANRAWTGQKARQFARYIHLTHRPRIAFIEEPCQTCADSLLFAKESGIAIAWDESLREDGFDWQLPSEVRAVVIKPTLTGSLQKVAQQVAQAHRLGVSAVISSSLESSLGLTQLARLARWLTPQTTPGLDTLDLMQAQLLRCWPGSPLPCLGKEVLEAV